LLSALFFVFSMFLFAIVCNFATNFAKVMLR
jgi:hypothetical protein